MRNEWQDKLARNSSRAQKQLGLLDGFVRELRELQKTRGLTNTPAGWRISTLPRRSKNWTRFVKLGRVATHVLPVADLLFDFCADYLRDDLLKDVDCVLLAEDRVNGATVDLHDAIADVETLAMAGASRAYGGNDKRICTARLEAARGRLVEELSKSGDAYSNVIARVKQMESVGQLIARLDDSVNRGGVARQIAKARVVLAGLPDTFEWKGSMQ